MALGEAPWTVGRARCEIDPDLRWEIDRGELIVREPASFWPGAVGARIARVLVEFVEAEDLGMVVGADAGFWLARAPDTLRAPDAAFVSGERCRRIADLDAQACEVFVALTLAPQDEERAAPRRWRNVS